MQTLSLAPPGGYRLYAWHRDSAGTPGNYNPLPGKTPALSFTLPSTHLRKTLRPYMMGWAGGNTPFHKHIPFNSNGKTTCL